jgi:hypothetical protein
LWSPRPSFGGGAHEHHHLRAIWDPKLFKPWFRDPASWAAWFAFLRALFALPLPEDDLAIYQQCTGRTEAPTKPATEGWLICGRRAGKSFMLALIAVYLACFHQYRRYLAPGERATIMIIARDRKQSRVIFVTSARCSPGFRCWRG